LHRYEPVRERGTLRAFGLAVLTHLLLIAFLYFGVQWQSSTPRGEEAELWDEAAVQQAVQTAPPPPEVKPEPVIKAPPTKVEEEADIALEQKRKRERENVLAWNRVTASLGEEEDGSAVFFNVNSGARRRERPDFEAEESSGR
jgi:colicin import membrane protein